MHLGLKCRLDLSFLKMLKRLRKSRFYSRFNFQSKTYIQAATKQYMHRNSELWRISPLSITRK